MQCARAAHVRACQPPQSGGVVISSLEQVCFFATWLQTGVTQQWIAPAGVTSVKILLVGGEGVMTQHVHIMPAKHEGTWL
jgi:hypothetical protein